MIGPSMPASRGEAANGWMIAVSPRTSKMLKIFDVIRWLDVRLV